LHIVELKSLLLCSSGVVGGKARGKEATRKTKT
jgi:hypothetical protein